MLGRLTITNNTLTLMNYLILSDGIKKKYGPLFSGSGTKARESYVDGITKALINMKRFLKDDANVFIVANDKYDLYPIIAQKCGLKIVNKLLFLHLMKMLLFRSKIDKMSSLKHFFFT